MALNQIMASKSQTPVSWLDLLRSTVLAALGFEAELKKYYQPISSLRVFQHKGNNHEKGSVRIGISIKSYWLWW